MNDFSKLPKELEQVITDFIQQKFIKDNLNASFQNPLLREEVLTLLDLYCTVVYFPVLDEENNGFRLKDMPFADGSLHDFVFINTAQTTEKQVFTAAHELGHIWNIDDYVIEKGIVSNSAEIREQIINRFAAILLMPTNQFKVAVRTGIERFGGNKITFSELLELIVILMNQFFAPMKAVVRRLVELGFISKEVAQTLFGNKDIPAEVFHIRIQELIREFGYTNLLYSSKKRWIDGLSQMLDTAEQKHLVPENKIKIMREKFGLQPASSDMSGLPDIIINK